MQLSLAVIQQANKHLSMENILKEIQSLLLLRLTVQLRKKQ